MSAVLVAQAPAVCAAPAPVAEHISRCIFCPWRQLQPCTSASGRVQNFPVAEYSGKPETLWRHLLLTAVASSRGVAVSLSQTAVTAAATCRAGGKLHLADLPCPWRLCQPCAQHQRHWQNTSSGACYVRGTRSSRARSTSASGGVHPCTLSAVPVAPAPVVRTALALVAEYSSSTLSAVSEAPALSACASGGVHLLYICLLRGASCNSACIASASGRAHLLWFLPCLWRKRQQCLQRQRQRQSTSCTLTALKWVICTSGVVKVLVV